jgi:hypothetical protein
MIIMKRPLVIFSIYLMVFMGMVALTAPATEDSNIATTTVAQADKVQIIEIMRSE